jgi:3-oxoacyl-[acyl-carrier protein] reductase
MDINDKAVIITGGGSGIGETVAKVMARKGAKVILGDIGKEGVDRVVQEIRDSGGVAEGRVVDVTDEQQVTSFMAAAAELFGEINVVVPCAGIIRDGLILSTDRETGKVKKKMSLEQFQSVIDINLTGTFLTLREAAALMIDNRWEGVLFTISSVNKVGQVGQLNYSSTKAAVAMWPKLFSGEFHMKGITHIRTVGIAPGYVGTPMLKNMNQDALAAILKDVHIGRLIEPEEIADLMLSVIGNDALDGTTIEITGGVTYGPRQIAK